VNDTLPAGLTATAIQGTNWNCTQPAGPCTRSDALAANASYPAITLTVTVASGAAASIINTATVSGGGETNTANNSASDPTTTVAPVSGSPVSIWSAGATPGTPWRSDGAVTLGVKFRADVNGTISGIRFYKGAGNNGTHIGLLYNSSGTVLAQATFTGETASGWQQVNFASPVAITAGATYIAAYFSTTGYAYDGNFFSNNGVDNIPLHALRSGVDGLNGVYAYGGSPQCPANSSGDVNYWADVVFSPQP
jgi:hypothetical protein